MYNHFGKHLPFAGNPVKYESSEIEIMISRKLRLEKELNALNIIIQGKEKDFVNYIKDEWTSDEINEAKEKAERLSTF